MPPTDPTDPADPADPFTEAQRKARDARMEAIRAAAPQAAHIQAVTEARLRAHVQTVSLPLTAIPPRRTHRGRRRYSGNYLDSGTTGRHSAINSLPPEVIRVLDGEILAGMEPQKDIALRYGLTHFQVSNRKKDLLTALGISRHPALAGRAGEALEWAAERTKEVYQLAADKTTPVLDPATGTPLMSTITRMGQAVQQAMTVESPDMDIMLEAVKQMHALGKTFGEFEQKVGKLAELQMQKELGIGVGVPPANGIAGGGWGGMGQLNVLVMPKEAGVEAAGPMPPLPPPRVQLPRLNAPLPGIPPIPPAPPDNLAKPAPVEEWETAILSPEGPISMLPKELDEDIIEGDDPDESLAQTDPAAEGEAVSSTDPCG